MKKKFYVNETTLFASLALVIFSLASLILFMYFCNKYISILVVDSKFIFIAVLFIGFIYQAVTGVIYLLKLYTLWSKKIPIVSISDTEIKNNFKNSSPPIQLKNISFFEIEHKGFMSCFVVRCKNDVELKSTKYEYSTHWYSDNKYYKKIFYWYIPFLFVPQREIEKSINFYKDQF